ncbi:hypothetical protein B0J13DRAFT_557013 [Dactylonectria estremocensis]|uniref:Transcription factor domain-containing protein n=1 Tax=Dactylonectria estremocensis TaxID=1079267 RepID=A0A9P9J4B1_9HYPO|nr:hypothetical protein B0J13DRAFT_557013 [Dactylonectria estremocensis]
MTAIVQTATDPILAGNISAPVEMTADMVELRPTREESWESRPLQLADPFPIDYEWNLGDIMEPTILEGSPTLLIQLDEVNLAQFPHAEPSWNATCQLGIEGDYSYGARNQIQRDGQPETTTSSHRRSSICHSPADEPTHRPDGAVRRISHNTETPPKEVINLSSALSDHFFREVIALYCTWDSDSNDMRILTGNMWQSSGIIYHTIQSMAASCLAKNFPHLAAVAKRERSHAVDYLNGRVNAAVSKKERLLSLMLLGHTASWIDPHDLAQDQFRDAQIMTNSIASEMQKGSNWAFFEQSMDHWSMLLAFLTDKGVDSVMPPPSIGPEQPTQSQMPHPFSGISHQLVKLVTDTGRLIFRTRKRLLTLKYMTETDMDAFQDGLREARSIERSLFAYVPMDVSCMVGLCDPSTTLNHFQQMDQAFQYTALLQIYRVFPDLLAERYQPWNKYEILLPQAAHEKPTRQEMDIWLTKLAMHILSILQEIPFESPTRCIQPFIFAAVSGELKYTQHLVHLSDGVSVPFPPIDHASIEVARARQFTLSRLSAYGNILTVGKVQQICQLLNCVWDALDAGDGDVYWVDLAYKKQLGTMMG